MPQHSSTAIKDLEKSLKILNTRTDLLFAAYPNLTNLRLLKDKLKYQAELEQISSLFKEQGWASFEKKPVDGIFTVGLSPAADHQKALRNLETIFEQTSVRAFCPHSPLCITLWGHAPTVLSRIGMSPDYNDFWDWPMTTTKLISEQERTAVNIINILAGSRTALDLLMY